MAGLTFTAWGSRALVVDPMTGNTVEEKFNPFGRTFAATSTLCCTSNQADKGAASGAVASEETICNAVRAASNNFRARLRLRSKRTFEAGN